MSGRTFYTTTPIYYVNDVPHIGHAYTTLACDVMARFKRLDGYDVHFLTGTDEHGQKVEKAAAAAGMSPQAFTDKVSQSFRDLVGVMNYSPDDFIRTTEQRHYVSCQALWEKLVAAGDIYLGKYAGWYSVRDEAFYAEGETEVGPDGKRRAGPVGNEVEWVEEPSYFFRLSAMGRPAARLLREEPALHRAGKPAQRGHQLREGRPAGPLGVAHQLLLGHPGAGRSQAHHVCLAGRAHQLHHRVRLSRREQSAVALLAGRPAYRGQGHHPLPLRVLAGLPDVGRRGAAPAGVRLRLVDDRGPEDLEVAGQRDRSVRGGPRVRRSIPCATSCCARCRSATTATSSAAP